jgi:amino acid adenylation domain-containing protein
MDGRRDDPGLPLMSVGLPTCMTPGQLDQVLRVFNETTVPYPQDRLVHELFEEQAARTPGAVAVIDVAGEFTYGNISRTSDEFAARLRNQGVTVGEYVPVMMPRSVQLLISQIAVLKCGGAYVPIDPQTPKAKRDFVIRDCGARRVIVDSGIDANFDSSGVSSIVFSSGGASTDGATNSQAKVTIASSTPAYVMYTSGSTGSPKGVVVSHRAVNRLVINNNYARIVPTDCIAHHSNPSFDASTFEIWGALLSGARTLVIPQSKVLDAEQFSEALREGKATILYMSVGLFAQYAVALASEIEALRYLLVGGDVVDPELARRLLRASPPGEFLNVYGPTECTTFSTSYHIESVDDSVKPIPIGKPLSNTQVLILDGNLQPVPVGIAGEICIGGEGVALGYLNRPEQTAQQFIPDPFSADAGTRLYRSGDFGRWQPDGNIEFIGRKDSQVKIRGYRVELGEVEMALQSTPGIQQAVVIAREDAPGEKRLVGYIVADLEQHELQRVRDALKEKLPSYMVPAAIVVLDKLPLTATGKADRRALPAPDFRAYSSREYQAPEGKIEEALAQIWRDTLHVEKVGRDHNFFELGGHSLLSMKLASKVAEKWTLSPAEISILQYPTIRKMAGLVERALSGASRPTSRGVSDEVPLTFSQRYKLNEIELNKRSNMQTPMPVRLSGRLHMESLRKTLSELFRRHEALRTRAVSGGSSRRLETSEASEFNLKTIDLSEIAGTERERQAKSVVETLTVEAGASGNLFSATLLRLDLDDHVLVIVWDHLIFDGASIGILWRDIWTIYAQCVRRVPIVLPEIPIQYADYAVWQQKSQKSWLEQHGAYWAEHLAGGQRVRLFPGTETSNGMRPGWGHLPIQFGASLCAKLLDLSRREGTTLAMCFLSAYVAAILRCCNQSEVVVPFISMGRPYPELENTIGFFGTVLFLRIVLRENDSFLDLLERVTREYGSAYVHDDSCRIAAQIPQPEFLRNPVFNWFPQEFDLSQTRRVENGDRESPIEVRPFEVDSFRVDDCDMDDEPRAILLEGENGVSGFLRYRTDRVEVASVEQFERNWSRFIKELSRAPNAIVAEVSCVA